METKKKNRWIWLLLLLLLLWWWWRHRKNVPAPAVIPQGSPTTSYASPPPPPDVYVPPTTPTPTVTYTDTSIQWPESNPDNPPIFGGPGDLSGTTQIQPGSPGTSYYTQTVNPGVLDITEQSFDGINVANYAKLDAFPSSLGRGDDGTQLGVYSAYVQARAAGEDLTPYLAELNAALHAIYG